MGRFEKLIPPEDVEVEGALFLEVGGAGGGLRPVLLLPLEGGGGGAGAEGLVNSEEFGVVGFEPERCCLVFCHWLSTFDNPALT